MRCSPWLCLVLVGCSDSGTSVATSDGGLAIDSLAIDTVFGNPINASCVEAFAHIVADGLVPFGPQYGAFPPRMLPPQAFLAPYECIAVRIETLAPDGLHIVVDADA